VDDVQTQTPQPISINGKAPTSDQRGSRIADRTVWLDLPEPWDNLEIKAWLDYPQEVSLMWMPVRDETPHQAGARMVGACKEVFLDHRGANGAPWEDEDGVLPSPKEDEFWERISNPLMKAILERFFEELNTNPTSRSSRKKKRAVWKRR